MDALVPSRRYPDVTLAQLRAELARERAARARLYPRRIEQGHMSQHQADHELALIGALVADLERIAHIGPVPPASHDLSWRDRRDAIARELAWRGHVYPRWIDLGRLSQDDADHRTACLEALADVFDEGFDWHASNGAAPAFHETVPTAEQRQARFEWDEHWRGVEARRAPPQQEELFAHDQRSC
jgi:hypothetical protein